tara:strand:- start:357 stop:680 length:324 start_codon:yes stop_codon:yes gene_type:complete
MDNERLNVEELVSDLDYVFGSQNVLVIDENTDFSKLGNPFIDNSKNEKEKMSDRELVAIEVATKKRMDKHLKLMHKKTGMKFTSISFLSSAVDERILKDAETIGFKK